MQEDEHLYKLLEEVAHQLGESELDPKDYELIPIHKQYVDQRKAN